MTQNPNTGRPGIAIQPVKSSMFSGIGYDQATETLVVQYATSGRVYHHPGVPHALAKELLAADSPGRYFNSYVRNAFPGTRIDDTEEPAGDE